MAETTECQASIWPHRHMDELTGPLDVVISYSHQPQVVRDWPQRKPVRVCLEQPDERTNLTFIRLALGCRMSDEEKGMAPKLCGPWHNASQYLKGRGRSRKVYIRSRITNQMKHPIPRGNWKGICQYENDWCLFTFQAMTMKVKVEKPRIVLPDGFSPGEKGIILS